MRAGEVQGGRETLERRQTGRDKAGGRWSTPTEAEQGSGGARAELRRPAGVRNQEGELAWDSGMVLQWSSEEESRRKGRATAS
jgi:hypothetical protein